MLTFFVFCQCFRIMSLKYPKFESVENVFEKFSNRAKEKARNNKMEQNSMKLSFGLFQLPSDWTTVQPKNSFPRSFASPRSTRARTFKVSTKSRRRRHRKVCRFRPGIRRTTSSWPRTPGVNVTKLFMSWLKQVRPWQVFRASLILVNEDVASYNKTFFHNYVVSQCVRVSSHLHSSLILANKV